MMLLIRINLLETEQLFFVKAYIDQIRAYFHYSRDALLLQKHTLVKN